MEVGDPPLMTSWAPEAMALFADELRELEELSTEQRQKDVHAEEAARAQATQTVDHMLQQRQSPALKGPKARGAASSEARAAAAAERTRLIDEGARELIEEQNAKQPWRRVLSRFEDVQRETERTLEPIRVREQNEFDFFVARPLHGYSMDDIVGTGQRRARSNSNAAALANAAQADAIVAAGDLVIDAGKFAQEYNDTLIEEYGFKPILGTSGFHDTPRQTLEEKEQSLREQQDLISTHRPGLGTVPPEFVLNTQPRVVFGERLPELPKSVTQLCRAGGSGHPQKQQEAAAATNMAATYPTGLLPHIDGAAAAGASSSSAHRDNQQSPSPSQQQQHQQPTYGIECSAKTNSVQMTSVTGQSVRQVLRFTNRNAHRIRLRLKGSDHPWLTYKCLQVCPVPGYGGRGKKSLPPESPLTCGGYIVVELCFDPTDMSEPHLREVLQVGVTRELNSRSGEGGVWEFFDVRVACEVVPPTFILRRSAEPESGGDSIASTARPHMSLRLGKRQRTRRTRRSASRSNRGDFDDDEDDTSLTVCSFPPTLVLAQTTQHYQIENTGSKAMVNILSDSPVFEITPQSHTATVLEQGDVMDVSIVFAPTDEGPWEGRFTVVVREDEDGIVLAEHVYSLDGTAVIPRFSITRINQTVFTGDAVDGPEALSATYADAIAAPHIPRYIAEDTAPEVPTKLSVCVRNRSHIPFGYHWAVESGGGAPPPTVSISPPCGTFPANEEVVFTLVATAHATTPLIAAFNLFVDGLPEPQLVLRDGSGGDEDEEAASSHNVIELRPSSHTPMFKKYDVPEGITQLLGRNKMLPSAIAAFEELRERSLRIGQTKAVEEAAATTTDAYCDPYAAFSPYFRPQDPESMPGTFMTGFFFFANPVPPSLSIVPPQLAEVVECLTGCDNVRRVTLQNPTPSPLRYFWDPSEKESGGRCGRRSQTDQDRVTIQCLPRTGRIPPFGSVNVSVHFTVHAPGPHTERIVCFVPEVADRLPADALCDPYALTISVTGVGPSVHTSTELLDFGLIEMGGEAAASFTVTNDNAVPVVFDLQDPMLREPPRFVFTPPSFRLAPGDAVEVTVYRKAVSAEDAQTFFELVVRDGATIAIETRATIQTPIIMLDDPTINFGVVPERIWQEKEFFLTNTSALDVAYTVELASPHSPYLEMEVVRNHVLRAGQSHAPVLVRACFHPRPQEQEGGGDGGYLALLGIRTKPAGQVLLVEVRCDSVETLSVSVGIATTVKPHKPLRLLDRSAPAPGPVVFQDPSDITPEAFIKSLLWNIVKRRILWIEDESAKSTTTGTLAQRASGLEDNEHVAASYSAPVLVRTTLPDDSPICIEHMELIVRNHTRCITTCTAAALQYAFMLTPFSEGTLERRQAEGAESTAASVEQDATNMVRSMSVRNTGGEDTAAAQTGNAVGLAAWIANYLPVFWTTAMNGTEQRERTRRTALAGAQRLLLDGLGCNSTVSTQVEQLGPLADVRVPITMLSNLPGRFEEVVRVNCDRLPNVDLPVTWEVHGRPVLLDPTTSGLTCLDKHDVLIMPPVIASLGTSKRSLRLMNRAPRDVQVTVELFLCSSTFAVMAVDENADASSVVVKLGPISDDDAQRDRDRFGHATASPSTFFMAAMATKEVILEYTPDIKVVESVLKNMDASLRSAAADGDEEGGDAGDDQYRGARSQEVDWNGSVIIYSELAKSAFNDSFLIDEFYQKFADEFPSQRTIHRRTGEDNSSGMPWLRSIVREVPMLQVIRPLRTRPGRVVRNSRMLVPTQAERYLLDRELNRRERIATRSLSPDSGSGVASPLLLTQNNNHIIKTPTPSNSVPLASCNNSDSDDEDEEGGDTSNVPLLDAESGSLRPLSVLLDEESERQRLSAYLETRREEARLSSHEYFLPIELRLRARCGVPRLSVQPSPSRVDFPMYRNGERCFRTVRLTNYNSAALYFTMRSTDPDHFCIMGTELVPSHVEEDPLLEDDEESHRAQQNAKQLKWCSLAEQKRMQRMMKLQAQGKDAKPTGIVGYHNAADDNGNNNNSSFYSRGATPSPVYHQKGGANSRALSTSSGPTPMYCLKGSDAIDVTIECIRSPEEIAAPSLATSLDGVLTLRFLHQSATTLPRSRPSTGKRPSASYGSNRLTPTLPRSSPHVEQAVPLRVPLSIPKVTCSPELLWFRPGKTVHDGREQSDYAQRITLYNTAEEPATFVLVPVEESVTQDVAGATTTSTTTNANATINANATTNASTLKASLAMTKTATTVTAKQLTRECKIREVVRMPDAWLPAEGHEELLLMTGHESEKHFHFSPKSGVIPAATAGGEPGRATVLISFSEYSDVRYERAVCVWVNGEPTDAVFVIRGDSRDTEV